MSTEVGLPGHLDKETSFQTSITSNDSHDISYKDFHYNLGHTGSPWATLTITADSQISKNIPTFIESNPIKGRVSLDLPKPDSITGVEIKVTGQILVAQNNFQANRDDMPFLSFTKTLWSKESGLHPRAGDNLALSDGKLSGSYNMDFSIELPETATLLHYESHPFRLPGTMEGLGLPVGVEYCVTMTIVRGKFHMNDVLADIPFGYIPIIHAPPFPFLRWESFKSGLPPMGPIDDPEGWAAMKPITWTGTASDAPSVTVTCSLFLGKPLVYVRGSFIPLYLELEGDDSQLLEVLQNPEAITCTLRRSLKERKTDHNKHDNSTDELKTWKQDDIEKAVWWVTPDQEVEGTNKVSLHGELHLGADLPSSLAIGRFTLEYTLCIFPFETVGFKPSDKKTKVLLEQPIEIVTAFPDQVRPVSQAPPGVQTQQVAERRVFQAFKY